LVYARMDDDEGWHEMKYIEIAPTENGTQGPECPAETTDQPPVDVKVCDLRLCYAISLTLC